MKENSFSLIGFTISYIKLINDFARRRRAGIHNKKLQGVINIEIKRTNEEKRSIALNGSPVNINSPFMKRRPEQKRIN